MYVTDLDTLRDELIWLQGETLVVTFADEPLARYRVSYQPDEHHLANVDELDCFETPYRSPQPPLWEPSEGEWLSMIRLPPYAPRRQRPSTEDQHPVLPFVTDWSAISN
jgi:hypothetical protein